MGCTSSCCKCCCPKDPDTTPLIYKSSKDSVKKMRGAIQEHVDSKYLDPRGDKDFTNKTDDGTKILKGGHAYNKPNGWMRFGIKVIGKYENDNWLKNTGDSNGEWAVSYHGTKSEYFNPICKKGYKIRPGAAFGIGVYSSPFINETLGHAHIYEHKGERYQGVFQNRVNPKGIQIVNAGKYWVCKNIEDIRPYALCIRKYN